MAAPTTPKRQARISVHWTEDYASQIRRSGSLDKMTTKLQFAEVSYLLFHPANLNIFQHHTDIVTVQLDGVRISAHVSPEECILVIPKEDQDDNADKESNIRVFRLPLLKPTCGHRCIDIRPLLAKSGVATYDPGFVSTASCHSAITFIDGPEGMLLHRGYRIEDLCANSDFEELSFLLLYGELPSKEDKVYHRQQIQGHTMVHEKMIEVTVYVHDQMMFLNHFEFVFHSCFPFSFIGDSGIMHIRWPLCVLWWVLSLRFITTKWISPTLSIDGCAHTD